MLKGMQRRLPVALTMVTGSDLSSQALHFVGLPDSKAEKEQSPILCPLLAQIRQTAADVSEGSG